jgi:hypothetical protein
VDIQTQVQGICPPNWYKDYWVICGFTQCLDVDYNESFGLVVKPTTIYIMLTLALSWG